MGYINVQRNLGGGGSSTYIAEKVKIKETVEAPDKWMLNKDLSVVLSGYSPTMSSDLVASNFSGYAGYNIPINQIADTTEDITSVEQVIKLKVTTTSSYWSTAWQWEGCAVLHMPSYSYDIGIWSPNYPNHESSRITLTPNTWYWIKIETDSSMNITCSYSTDGENYTVFGYGTAGTFPSDWIQYPLTIGKHAANTSEGFSQGQIDFKETYVKFNGTKTFYAVHQLYHKYYDNTEGGDNS